jgi:hypothetical protein
MQGPDGVYCWHLSEVSPSQNGSHCDRTSDKVVDAEQIKRVVSKNAKNLVFKTSTWD